MAFLHGAETNEKKQKTFSVKTVPTAVICLTGIAPYGALNTLKQVTGTSDAAQFGPEIPGFSIPQALAKIFEEGPATVIVCNVFDKTSHCTAVTAESQTVTNRAAKTSFYPVLDAQTPTVTDSTGSTTYVAGADYTIDDFGNLQILSSSIAENATIKITYKKLNSSAITSSVIVGGIDGTTGAKSGMFCFEDTLTLFGYKPKLLIAPGYVTLSGVITKMQSDAAKYRAIYLVDAPVGTTIANAIAGRLPSGSINFYNYDSRAILCYPEINSQDNSVKTTSYIPKPFSQSMAGVISATDDAIGFWASPSNKQIQGGVSMEVTIGGSLTDSNADCQKLNAQGIVTLFNKFGKGLFVWGNRNASYPVNTAIDSFICVRRSADIIEDSVEAASLDFADGSINQAFIDTVRDAINTYFRTLISLGAIIDGSCTFDPAKNPPSQLASGNIIFDYEFVSPPPAERITYNSTININLLSKLK